MKPTAYDRAKNIPKRRANLIAKMGGKCVCCGTRLKLEFHHKNNQRLWVARKTSRWVRMSRYEKEYEEGILELRCRHCNAVENSKRVVAVTSNCEEIPL